MFTCIKSLNRYNLRHNNCVIFSIFLYFKYSFLLNSFIYKFVHAIIILFIKRKASSCLSIELLKIYQCRGCLIILSNRVQLLTKELLIKKSSVVRFIKRFHRLLRPSFLMGKRKVAISFD